MNLKRLAAVTSATFVLSVGLLAPSAEAADASATPSPTAAASTAPGFDANVTTEQTYTGAADDQPLTTTNALLRIVDALKASNVVVLPGANLATENELTKVYAGSTVGIIVVPDSLKISDLDKKAGKESDGTAGSNASYESFAAQVRHFMGETKGLKVEYKTIILLSSNGRSVSTAHSQSETEDLLNTTTAKHTEILLLSRNRIEDLNTIAFSEWGWIFYIPAAIVGIILLAMLVGGIFDLRNYLRRRKVDRAYRRKEKEAQEAKDAKAAEAKIAHENLVKKSPTDLRAQLALLTEWMDKNVRKSEPKFAAKMDALAERFYELFRRLDERASDQQKQVALVGYRDILTKLSTILSDRYYKDIKENPTLWDDPKQRIQEVHEAVDSVYAQLLENIKQVNALQDLDFQTALNSLNSQAYTNPEAMINPADEPTVD